ncbi:hypothetical protein TGFOU_406770, partial [Toxoplasma gondii FOU]
NLHSVPSFCSFFSRLGALQPCLRLLTTCSAVHAPEESRDRHSTDEDDAALAVKVVKTALTILSLIVANNPDVQEAVYKQHYQEKAASLTRHLLQEGLLAFSQVEKYDLPGAVAGLLERTPFTSKAQPRVTFLHERKDADRRTEKKREAKSD